MTSQLNVDTIVDKAGSGGTNVKIGNTSTYVSDVGAVTQNTVESLVKTWWRQAANGASIDDSFNISSVTDNAAGNLNPQYANVFSGASNLAMTVGARNSGTSGMVYTAALVSTTGQGGFVHYENGSTADPLDWTGLQISGDLA